MLVKAKLCALVFSRGSPAALLLGAEAWCMLWSSTTLHCVQEDTPAVCARGHSGSVCKRTHQQSAHHIHPCSCCSTDLPCRALQAYSPLRKTSSSLQAASRQRARLQRPQLLSSKACCKGWQRSCRPRTLSMSGKHAALHFEPPCTLSPCSCMSLQQACCCAHHITSCALQHPQPLRGPWLACRGNNSASFGLASLVAKELVLVLRAGASSCRRNRRVRHANTRRIGLP